MTEYDKIPKAIKSEEWVIGAILFNEKAYLEVADILKPEAFYNLQNKQIYEVIGKMYNENIAIDIVSLYQYLLKEDPLSQLDYLVSLSREVPTSTGIVTHARIVYENMVKRNLIKLSSKMKIESQDKGSNPFEVVAKYIQQLAEQTASLEQLETRDATKWTVEVNESIENASKGKFDGITSHIYTLDKMLMGGFHNSKLYIIAGRPSMGKTSFMINLVNKNRDKKTMIYSADQTINELGQRLLTNSTGITAKDLKQIDYKMTENKTKIIYDELGNYYKENNIFINDNSSWDIDDLYMNSISMAKKHKIEVIIVDYMQQLHSRAMSKNSRNDQLTYISEKLKELSKVLKVPVICLSQLNRIVESRNSRMPMLSDLRESGGIEQAANVVLMMYVPSKYNFDEFPKQSVYSGKLTRDRAEIIVAKQKDGGTGSVLLHYSPELYRYFDIENNYEEEPVALPF